MPSFASVYVSSVYRCMEDNCWRNPIAYIMFDFSQHRLQSKIKPLHQSSFFLIALKIASHSFIFSFFSLSLFLDIHICLSHIQYLQSPSHSKAYTKDIVQQDSKMKGYFICILSLASAVSAVYLPATSSVATAAPAVGTPVSITPHQQYSSSIGVLGCMINTNRVAYFPSFPDCGASICMQVSYGERSVNLLHIDQSGGAHDISYDAWNYLYTGQSATKNPTQGGGIPATYTVQPMSACSDLITSPDKRLPFSAANSMNYISNCISTGSNWVAQNYGLWNIATSACTYGKDEECKLNLKASNQPTCPSQLGLQTPLASMPVFDVEYGTGKPVLAIQIHV